MNEAWTLVDLPGYGYAKRSRSAKGRFRDFVSDYLVNRPNLLCVFILIDSRLSPQKIDLGFVEWVVECKIPFALIFTKTDKTKAGPLRKNIEKFKEALAERCDGIPKIFTSSTKANKGRLELLEFIDQAVSMRHRFP
jgi:GTP-binding protein